MKDGDPITVLNPLSPSRYQIVRAEVRHTPTDHPWAWTANTTGSGWIRPLAPAGEGTLWARGHGDDVAAALLLTGSVQ